MVALAAVIAIGVITTVSVERDTATWYNSRYQADLAVQNGLQAAAKTLAAAHGGINPMSGKDTFLVVRADGSPDANGTEPAFTFLAQPSPSPSNSITYYPIFSASNRSQRPERCADTDDQPGRARSPRGTNSGSSGEF